MTSSKVGKFYGKLRVIRNQGFAEYGDSRRQSKWLCQCLCGELTIKTNNFLTQSKFPMCPSCFKVQKRKPNFGNRKHGMAGTPSFRSWSEMKTRCYKKDSPNYYKYGQRGIKVCDRWLESFENFYEDMGDRPEGMTLDRIDNDGDYSPENCRWATSSEQARNRRSNILIELDGEVKCLKEWCDKFSMSYKVVNGRLYNSPHLHTPSTVFSGFYKEYAKYIQQGKTYE